MVVHVPTCRKMNKMNLYTFKVVPLRLTDRYSIEVSTKNLVYARKANGYALELDLPALTKCITYGYNYFCEDLNVLHKQKQSCLRSLATHDLASAQQTCSAQIVANQDGVLKVSQSTYFMNMFRDNAEAVLSCPTETTYVYFNVGYSTYNVPKGCRLTLANMTIVEDFGKSLSFTGYATSIARNGFFTYANVSDSLINQVVEDAKLHGIVHLEFASLSYMLYVKAMMSTMMEAHAQSTARAQDQWIAEMEQRWTQLNLSIRQLESDTALLSVANATATAAPEAQRLTATTKHILKRLSQMVVKELGIDLDAAYEYFIWFVSILGSALLLIFVIICRMNTFIGTVINSRQVRALLTEREPPGTQQQQQQQQQLLQQQQQPQLEMEVVVEEIETPPPYKRHMDVHDKRFMN